jgi:hypothetical protein
MNFWLDGQEISSKHKRSHDTQYNDTQHNDIQYNNKLNSTPSIMGVLLRWMSFILSVANKPIILYVTMLIVVMLSVANKPIMLSVVMLIVVMLSVVAPHKQVSFFSRKKIV